MSAPSLTDLKSYLGGQQSLGSDHDEVLEQALAAAIATVEREAGIYASVQGEARVLHLSGGAYGTRAIWFTSQPVAISKVEVRGYTALGGADSWTEIDAADWEQVGSRLARVGGTLWPAGYSNIRVSFAAGFDNDAPMPADLKLAILKIAAADFRGRKTATPTSSRGGTEERRRRDADISEAIGVARSYRQVAGF